MRLHVSKVHISELGVRGETSSAMQRGGFAMAPYVKVGSTGREQHSYKLSLMSIGMLLLPVQQRLSAALP
jgi:hypothetical protein